MKKIIPLLLLIFLSFSTAFAQDYFETIRFQQALKKAKKKKKLVFIQLESKDCMQCNEVAGKGLNSPGVKEIIEKSFIAVLINSGSEDWEILTKKNKLTFGTLFFDASGQLLHKYARTTSLGEMYITEIKKVQQKKNDLADLSFFEKRYNDGEREYTFLRSFIHAKINNNLRVDTLVNDYLSALPKDSINKKDNILFLANTAPLIGSFADSIMRSDRNLFNACWKSLPNTERVRINQAIIFNSRLKAIKEKNVSYAYRVAGFAYGTYSPDAEAGIKARDKQMIYYAAGTKDSDLVYLLSNNYVNAYFIHLTKDSLQKKDSLSKAKMFGEFDRPPVDSIIAGGVFVQRRMIGFTPSVYTVTNELRELANYVYHNCNDSMKLEKAITWLNKAIELHSNANLLENKANILAHLGKREEAINTFKQALIEYKSTGLSGDWLIPKIKTLREGGTLPKEEDD